MSTPHFFLSISYIHRYPSPQCWIFFKCNDVINVAYSAVPMHFMMSQFCLLSIISVLTVAAYLPDTCYRLYVTTAWHSLNTYWILIGPLVTACWKLFEHSLGNIYQPVGNTNTYEYKHLRIQIHKIHTNSINYSGGTTTPIQIA